MSTFHATTDFGNRDYELTRSIEDPNVPLSVGAEEWYDVFAGAMAAESGVKVTPHVAMRIAAFWQGVTMLSGDVAKVPLNVYRRGDGSDRTVETAHPSHQIVRWQPNPDQSAFEWRRQMMTHAIVWQNAYSLIERNGRGDVIGLYPLLPDRTTWKKIDGRIVYQTEIDGQLQYFDSYDIWHVKGISFDGKSGLKLVSYARHALGKILAREKFASRFFRHGGRVGGILQLPWSKDKTKLNKKEEGFRKTYENNDSAFKTVILRDNAKFHAAQATFEQTQMVETSKEDVKVVARLLNMPPHKLGAEGSSSYNSLEQENQAYYDNSLSHWFCAFEAQSWLKLFSRETRHRGQLFFEHKVGALLWADSKTVANIGSNGVRSGWLLPNEVRGWFNLNSLPEGNKLLIPSGMVQAGAAGTETDTDESERQKSLLRSLERLIAQTRSQFVNDLARVVPKSAKNANDFRTVLEQQIEQLPDPFVHLRDTYRIATGKAPDWRTKIVRDVVSKLTAAFDSDEDLNEILGSLA